MVGSMTVVSFPDRDTFDEWLQNVPYMKNNIWKAVEVYPYHVAVAAWSDPRVEGRIVRRETASTLNEQERKRAFMNNIHITKAEGGEHWLVGTDVTTIKASGRHTSGNLLVMEVNVPPGGGPPVLHRHEYSETFLFQEGEFEVSTTDADGALTTAEISAGDTVSIPSMAWHNFKNVGATPGRFIAIHSPAVMEEFVQEIGTPIDDPENPPVLEGPPSDEERQRMMEIIGKYMEVLPPEKSKETK
jgi:mannose-6-phosphate isomerase-like protein (cupin superfamily)